LTSCPFVPGTLFVVQSQTDSPLIFYFIVFFRNLSSERLFSGPFPSPPPLAKIRYLNFHHFVGFPPLHLSKTFLLITDFLSLFSGRFYVVSGTHLAFFFFCHQPSPSFSASISKFSPTRHFLVTRKIYILKPKPPPFFCRCLCLGIPGSVLVSINIYCAPRPPVSQANASVAPKEVQNSGCLPKQRFVFLNPPPARTPNSSKSPS